MYEVHKRRRKYYTVRLGNTSHISAPPPSRPIDLLQDLVADDKLAIYPKRMIIGSLPTVPTSPRDVVPLAQSLSLKQRDRFLSILSFCRCGLDEMDDITKRLKYPYIIASLLLCLLPNVRAIVLCNLGSSSDPTQADYDEIRYGGARRIGARYVAFRWTSPSQQLDSIGYLL